MTAELNVQKVVIAKSSKSMGIAILLTVLLGPLGMLYSTIPGSVVMILISIVAGLFTADFGLLITWPLCVIWAAVAVSIQNKKLTSA
jgi:hypothetical protein